MLLHNEIFKKQIWEYLCNDMDSCLEANKEAQNGNTRFKGGLNYTSALAIFSVLDMVSGYFSDSESDYETSKNVANFLTEYLSKYDERFKDFAFSKKFYEVFRHGLSHQWEPKSSGISMDNSSAFLYIARDKVTVLAIPAFYEAIKKAIKDYENNLDTRTDLQEAFKKRYDEIVKKNREEMEKLKEMMKGIPIHNESIGYSGYKE